MTAFETDRPTAMCDYITRVLGVEPRLDSVFDDDDVWHWTIGNLSMADPITTSGWGVSLERMGCAVHLQYTDAISVAMLDRLKTVIGHAYVVPLLLSVIEAAEVSGVSRAELYRWIASGRLVAKKIGGKIVNGVLKGGKFRIRQCDLIAAIYGPPNAGD